jgi:ribosomal protein S18 acetylase RimI-like enzyme
MTQLNCNEQIQIRLWNKHDRASIIALDRELQAYEQTLRPSRSADPKNSVSHVRELEKALAEEDAGALFVAEVDGGVVGYLSCFFDEDEFEKEPDELRIYDLVVSEQWRRCGIARLLIESAEQLARQHEVERVNVTTLLNSDAAKATYKASGFKPIMIVFEKVVRDK